MNQDEFYNVVAPLESFVSALGFYGHQQQGRGAVVVQFDEGQEIEHISYCPFSDDLPEVLADGKQVMQDYKPESDVCIIGLLPGYACFVKLSPRIPPEIAYQFYGDAIEKTGDMFNTTAVVN